MPRKKPVILSFNKYYLPGYRAGGPIRTIANMVDRLGDEFDFRVVTSDRDVADREPYPGLTGAPWQVVGNAHVHYLSARQATAEYLAALINRARPSLIYLNSFFDPLFTQKVLIARRLGKIGSIPIVLAPRGEFSLGALGLKSLKKNLYIKAAKLSGLYKGITWQASSEIEQANIERVLGKVAVASRIRVAPDLAPVPIETEVSFGNKPRRDDETLRVCFLSRISPMKNLDFALRVLGHVGCPIQFTIYGPKEVETYWDVCEELIAQLPPHIGVEYGGTVAPEQVMDSLAAHDLFLLPTRGENYGHVIHEALGAGLPVLLSDQTPWGDVAHHGVGWTLPLNNHSTFARVIEEVATWDHERSTRARKASVEFARDRALDPIAFKANRDLFVNAMNGVAA